MQTIKHIQDLHKASAWATELILEALPEEYLEKETNSSFKTIKDTLIHLRNAQIIWYNRLTGNANAPRPSTEFTGSYADLKKSVKDGFTMYIDLLENKTDDYLYTPLTYGSPKGDITFTQPYYQILLQLTHHSALHRGQILAFMRQFGFAGTIPQTDLIVWYRKFKP